jgi:hypothetical protein
MNIKLFFTAIAIVAIFSIAVTTITTNVSAQNMTEGNMTGSNMTSSNTTQGANVENMTDVGEISSLIGGGSSNTDYVGRGSVETEAD